MIVCVLRNRCSESEDTVSGDVAARADSKRAFVPGMGVDWLLPLYDPITTLLGLNRARQELLRQAELRPGHRLLDIGCGTGSLVVLTKTLYPHVDVVGADPDDRALARAARKARRAGARIQLDRGFSDALDYPDGTFDRVLSSFMFHHLGRDEKARTLREVRRVLSAEGSLHLLDFGGEDSAGRQSRLPRLHSHQRLLDNDECTILRLLEHAGFVNPTKARDHAVLGGFARAVYYRAGGR
jgi:ubiquinone/menaquinone biosynthesis C-methylase UbiE